MAATIIKAEEKDLIVLGQYIGREYSDGSGSFGKKFDPEITRSCKTLSCELDRKNINDESVFDDKWSFQIKNDEITDKQRITVKRYAYKINEQFGEIKLDSNIYLWLNLSNKDQEVLCVAGHDYPKMKAVIRIDKKPAIETNEEGCLLVDEKIDSQMRAGQKITIRGYHWPYQGAETQEIDLGGYTRISQFLRSKREK